MGTHLNQVNIIGLWPVSVTLVSLCLRQQQVVLSKSHEPIVYTRSNIYVWLAEVVYGVPYWTIKSAAMTETVYKYTICQEI